MKNKIPSIWKYYFFFSVGMILIHLIRYLNFYLTKAVPVFHGTIDYSLYSNFSLFIRIICILISIILIKFRSKYPIIVTTISWTILFFLLSHEYELFLFLPVSIMTLFCYVSLFFYKANNKNYD